MLCATRLCHVRWSMMVMYVEIRVHMRHEKISALRAQPDNWGPWDFALFVEMD